MKNNILIFILLIIFTIPIFAQKSDSTKTKIGWWDLIVMPANYSVVIRSSDEENTNLQVDQLIGAGFDFKILYKGIWGLSLTGLAYTDGGNLYPITACGLNFQDLSVGMGWDFGKREGIYKSEREKRLCFLVSYKLSKLFEDK